MSRSLAIGLALSGIALLLGSCVPLGFMGYRLFMAEAAHTQPVAASGTTRTTSIAVAPNGLVRIALKSRIETDSVQEETSGGKTGFKARYRFPVTYRALDDHGKVLFEKTTEMAWDRGEKLMSQEHSTSSGGVLALQHNFEKFVAPASGRLSVEIEIGPDHKYSARLSDVQLLVYDKLVSETPNVVLWGSMFVGGMLLALFGFIFAITASATAPGAAMSPVESPEVHRYAALCHAAGFLGYVIPLGNVLGVLVAWLVWRNAGSFVDEQGKEALNFQIAVLAYMLLSLVLVLVLIGFVLLLVVGLAHLVLMVIAAANTANGRAFRYPLIFRLVK